MNKITYENLFSISIVALLAVLPLIAAVPQSWILYIFIFCVYLSMSSMWNLIAGYSGLISLCQPAFLGLAGYTLALGTWIDLPWWAGLIGGALSAALVGVPAASFLGGDTMLLVVGGMILALIAQGGDLLESWCKRRFGVKDSSHIIPGHGGILDRVDGLLAVLPVAFFYLWAAKDSI